MYGLPKADKKKKVVVVGGGPAGMEAARVAALRGHDVTLVEKSSKLGGLVPLAGLIKGLELEDLPGLLDYLKTQVEKTGVKVELGTEATRRVHHGDEARRGHPRHRRRAHLAQAGRQREGQEARSSPLPSCTSR